MTKPADFLRSLKSLTDDELSSALSLDPELLKKAQKALLDAKRKEADNAKRKSEETSLSSGRPFDLKIWARAKRLVSGPYNEANATDMTACLAKTDPSTTPEGEKSLLRHAMDYLSERDRVGLDWPAAVYDAGVDFGYEEAKSFINLFQARTLSNLGPKGRKLFLGALSRDLPWADFEKRMLGEKSLHMGLIDFIQKMCFSPYGASERAEAAPWEALENLASRGCKPLSTQVDANSYSKDLPWQRLIAQSAHGAEAADAKVSAFAAMIDLGWCDVGYTGLTDSLVSRKGSAGGLSDCGSRAAVPHFPLIPSSVQLFEMLCERESTKGFERFDAVGRSRLYFINEHMRKSVRPDAVEERKVMLAMAQRAIELGDQPESVNAQDPLAKCADQHFANMIAAAIEKRDIGGAVGAKASPRKRSSSL